MIVFILILVLMIFVGLYLASLGAHHFGDARDGGAHVIVKSFTKTDAIVWFYPCKFLKYHYKFNPIDGNWYRKSGKAVITNVTMSTAMDRKWEEELLKNNVKELWSKK